MAVDTAEKRVAALRFATGFPPLKIPDGGPLTAFQRASLLDIYIPEPGGDGNANEEKLLLGRRMREKYGRYR